MARKDVIRTEILSSQSLSSSFNGPATIVRNLDNCSYQINITTVDSVGTFTVQGSNDYNVSEPTNVVSNVGNWVSLTLGGGAPFVNAANDNIIIDLNQIPFNALRVIYTSQTPGTGTCNVWLVAKQLGG
jgi:hypothetical protein